MSDKEFKEFFNYPKLDKTKGFHQSKGDQGLFSDLPKFNNFEAISKILSTDRSLRSVDDTLGHPNYSFNNGVNVSVSPNTQGIISVHQADGLIDSVYHVTRVVKNPFDIGFYSPHPNISKEQLELILANEALKGKKGILVGNSSQGLMAIFEGKPISESQKGGQLPGKKIAALNELFSEGYVVMPSNLFNFSYGLPTDAVFAVRPLSTQEIDAQRKVFGTKTPEYNIGRPDGIDYLKGIIDLKKLK